MITSSARHPTHRRIRKSLNLIVALWLLIAGNASVLAEAAAETKPSFLVIVADDLGYGDLGCYGAEDIATPHLDRMAKEGTKFTSFYVEAVCSPTRAALMTGSHGRRVGYRRRPVRRRHRGSRRPGALHPALYGGDHPPPHRFHEARDAVPALPRAQHAAQPAARAPGLSGKSGRGLYGDVIQELDWSTGRILAALRDLGLDDSTLVVFTSDNGPKFSAGGSAGPLRGEKGGTLEGGVRVPCLARWPERIPAVASPTNRSR